MVRLFHLFLYYLLFSIHFSLLYFRCYIVFTIALHVLFICFLFISFLSTQDFVFYYLRCFHVKDIFLSFLSSYVSTNNVENMILKVIMQILNNSWIVSILYYFFPVIIHLLPFFSVRSSIFLSSFYSDNYT